MSLISTNLDQVFITQKGEFEDDNMIETTVIKLEKKVIFKI